MRGTNAADTAVLRTGRDVSVRHDFIAAPELSEVVRRRNGCHIFDHDPSTYFVVGMDRTSTAMVLADLIVLSS